MCALASCVALLADLDVVADTTKGSAVRSGLRTYISDNYQLFARRQKSEFFSGNSFYGRRVVVQTGHRLT